ncbi:MAG: response regulator, partial [Myxococcota bacterium]|nr:response regulator [Myxococcota bacterium]
AVLLVEDNLVNQEVSMGILQDLGYRPELAENGNEAVEKLSGGDHDFSAVLMDCQMPVLDGYQATELIRQRERGAARIPIIAMTSRAMSGDRDKALAAGMDDYITKPASPERLNSILAKWIKAPPKSS